MRNKKIYKGIAFVTLLLVIVIFTVFGLAIFSRSVHEWNFAQRQKDRIKALAAARAGLDKVTMDIYQAFIDDPNGWNPLLGINSFQWFANTLPGRTDLFPGRVSFHELFPNESANSGMFTVVLAKTLRSGETTAGIKLTADGAEIRIIAIGEVPVSYLGGTGTVKEIVANTISYEMGPSPVFNYAYFINNFGWLWGGGITVNGDVRSNGNFSFNGNPLVNGDIYAALNAQLGAPGTIEGNSRNLDIEHYLNQMPDRARPTNPTDPDNPTETIYVGGYNGTSQLYPTQDVLGMPYLGNLDSYKNLAQLKNGTISQGGGVIVDNVYSGNGPDNIAGTSDDGCLVLIGTEDNPINITGPVVVDKDVVIKGVVEGQGTIYAGRNIHVVGDIVYQDGPSWIKPDSNPQDTANANKQKDFIGLACKGNIIVGDYTRNDWVTTVRTYLKPPFTQAYNVDATDVSLGYDSDNNAANGYRFNGDYTAYDGGGKDNGSGGSASRRFYESSLSDTYIHSIAVSSSQIRQIDAITYNNHAWAGKVGNFNINGSIVCRDEAIIYSGNITINYDMRAYGNGAEYINLYLPRDLILPSSKTFTKLKGS